MDDITIKYSSESDNTDVKERAELSDTPVTDEVTVDNGNEITRSDDAKKELLMQECISNYIIVKAIISQLEWCYQVRCALVCRLWRDAVKSVQRENLHCYDFAVQSCESREARNKFMLEVSNLPVQKRLMFAIGFFDHDALERIHCKDFTPAPCNPPCVNKHYIIEAVHACMILKYSRALSVNGWELIYMPLPTSRTSRYTRLTQGALKPAMPIFAGLYLPEMPNVNYRTLQYRTEFTARRDVYSVVDDICTTDIIKGVIVFVDNSTTHRDDNLRFLNYFKDKQPDIPYALGGCVVRMAGKGTGTTDQFVTVTVGVFSVAKEPKPVPGPRCQFNVHSLIIDKTVYQKAAMQTAIQNFAKNISELEYSAALKLSCYGRHRLHNVEQELFRESFPRTTVLGCFSIRTIVGCSHPEPEVRPPPTKLTKTPSSGAQELTHSDSTVFVFLTWGKQRYSGEEAHHPKR